MKNLDNRNIIVLYTYNLKPGGAESVFVKLANSFVALDYVVLIVLVKKEGRLLEELDSRIKVIGLNSKHVLLSLFPLISLLRRVKPLVLLSTLKENNAVAVLAKIISCVNVKVVIREANTLSAELKKGSFLNRKITEFLVKVTYKYADKIVVLSNHMKADVMQFLRMSDKNIRVIYNPVDTLQIDYMQRESISDFNFDKNELYFCSAARLVPHKKHDTTIKAISHLHHKYNISVNLLIFGEGPDVIELEQVAKAFNVAHLIHFMGFKKNPFKYYKYCKCFILSSEYEGMPNSLIQALYCGLTVISSDSPGASAEILNGGQFGGLFSVGNHEELADMLYQLILDNNKYMHLSMDKYQLNSIADKYLRVIHD